MANLVLDAGVLIDLEQRKVQAEAWIEEAVDRKVGLLVAGATYTEVWKGYRNGKGYEMARVLKTVAPIPTSDSIGRRAGELIREAKAAKDLRFDAIVVATAAAKQADVLTNDLDDIKLLASYAGVRVLTTK